MVVGVDHVVAALVQAQVLQRTVGDHLVGVHVGGGAGAALDHVHHELLVQLAGDQVVAGLGNGIGLGFVDGAQLQVGMGGCLLHEGKGPDQLGHLGHGLAGDGKVLHGACRMHAPVGVGGMVLIPMKSCS
jgi:hypothetical protein